jgi:hypothetical protein
MSGETEGSSGANGYETLGVFAAASILAGVQLLN